MLQAKNTATSLSEEVIIMLQRIISNALKPHYILKKSMRKINAIFTKHILNKRRKIKFEGKSIFTMRNFGEITNMRIETFETKEPETLCWINGFKNEDTLLDIGANVGIYSLYAASRGHQIAAIEPDALNFALLCLNIKDNNFNELIIPYPYSMHESSALSVLNVDNHNWGATASSFHRSMDWTGKMMKPVFKQGSPGISIDDFTEASQFFPNHIKIDVDGNEFLILSGAEKTLSNPNCKSILVELFENHPEYQRCLSLIEKNGFTLLEKSCSPMFSSDAQHAENYIFVKKNEQ